jgi:hypothetical protein
MFTRVRVYLRPFHADPAYALQTPHLPRYQQYLLERFLKRRSIILAKRAQKLRF